MKFISWLKGMLEAQNPISSKRVCGVLGWIICIAVILYCTIVNKQAPTIMEFFIVSVVGLLGVDSITDIWKNKNE